MNNMRTPEEKEKILKEYISGTGISIIAQKYNVRNFLIYRWLKKYNENGIEGLKSKTGKQSSSHRHKGIYLIKPKNKIEELEIEIPEGINNGYIFVQQRYDLEQPYGINIKVYFEIIDNILYFKTE